MELDNIPRHGSNNSTDDGERTASDDGHDEQTDTASAGRPTTRHPVHKPPTLLLAAVLTLVITLVLASALLPSRSHEASILRGLRRRPAGHANKEDLYYDWNTTSAFDPVHIANATPEELCAAFPKYLLEDVQPVLKTGHGVLESRVRPQLDAGLSCLDNLLVFSDLSETFEGREVVDVIADTPAHLLNSTAQLAPYRRLRNCVARNSSSSEGENCGESITPKQGWQIDKFKFLPSVARAWRERPKRKWYVFFEADTYIVWDTVFRLLDNFDADEAWYFGSPSPGREGTWFAYGGTGFVLSRGTMRKLMSADEDGGKGLVESEWEVLLQDCCGDSVLGWALWERAGVEVSGLWPLFNPHAPRSVPFAGRYWCQPVLSMHKPSVEELEELWGWEWRERVDERPLLYRDLALSFFHITDLDRKEGWDNAAWDDLGFDGPPGGETVETIELDFANDCAEACREDEECFSWTHHVDTCTLVHSIRVGKARYLDEDGGEGGERDARFVAGWMKERIRAWVEGNGCGVVQWVKPSTERIF